MSHNESIEIVIVGQRQALTQGFGHSVSQYRIGSEATIGGGCLSRMESSLLLEGKQFVFLLCFGLHPEEGTHQKWGFDSGCSSITYPYKGTDCTHGIQDGLDEIENIPVIVLTDD